MQLIAYALPLLVNPEIFPMKKLALVLLATATASAAYAAPMSASEYVMTSAASDFYERTSSQVVLQSTRNPQIRAFAEMMLSAHSQSTAEIKTAAGRSGLKPIPPRMTALQTEMITQLRAERGTARDAAYLAQQRAAHNGALNVQKAYATEGSSAPLRSVAQTIVPMVESHIAMLMKM